jgi:hypothetical protein
MEWLESLAASGPMAAVLGTAVVGLWRALEASRKETADAQAARIDDLKSILKPND